MGGYTVKPEKIKKIVPESVSTMDANPTKPKGMPMGLKIISLFGVLALFGYGGYVEWYKTPSPNVPAPVSAQIPVQEFLFHKGEVVVAKCKDFKSISLYLDSDITLNDYNTTLMAVATIDSKFLLLPNQELSFNGDGKRIVVYKCQGFKGVLMGKLKKI